MVAEAIEGNRHNIAVVKPQPVFEAEHVGAEKVDMEIARPAVLGVFKVMVFQVRQ